MPSGGVSDVLAKFDLARLQSKKASDEEARRETSKGFRGGKSDTGKGTRTSKSGSSKAAAANTLIKVGSLQVITAGVNGEGKPRDDKCPNGPDVEDMADRGLAVSKSPDGEDLEFGLNWGFADIDAWMRAMLKPKLGFGVFDFLDTRYGGAPDRESDSHWVLVAKHNRKIYVKRGPVDGELLNSVKGSASGHRKYKEHAIRILTRHRIPFVLTQDWDVAVGRAMEEEVLKSESEAESTAKVKGGKGKARAKAKPRSVSSESSEAESSDSDPEVVAKDDVTGPPRRSSRFKDRAVVKTEELDVDPADIVPRSPSSHSGHSVPLFEPEIESEIEEITRPDEDDGSRKRSVSPSFDFAFDEERTKRARSASYDAIHDSDWYGYGEDDEHANPVSPFIQPVTSTPANTTSATSHAGPSAFGSLRSASTNNSAGAGPSTKPLARVRKGLQVPQSTSNIWRNY
ncbi:hypothetical protein C8R47DRAFT_1130278 [Mycena vitilis]|nr:hypothetical protein C8R47DRAFT_1130278 [Mycena vitilis]